MPMLKKPRKKCLNCGKEPARAMQIYCNNSCQMEYQHRTYIQKWKGGEIKGLQNIGIVSTHIKRYLREKHGNACCLCGWGQLNTKTQQVPLVADHIDGNWRNNAEENLRLLCPNCDSLTPTYAGSNKGKGRRGRIVSNRVKEARLINPKK